MSIAAIILMLVAAVAIAILTVYLVRMATQLTRTAAQLESVARTLNESLLPRMERVLDQAQAEMNEIRAATESVQRIVGSLRGFVDRAQTAVTPVIEALSVAASSLHQVGAVIQGVRAGWSSLRRRRAERRPDSGTGHGGYVEPEAFESETWIGA